MRKILLAIIFWGTISNISAQDSVAVAFKKDTSKLNPLLFNNTSNSLNNVFNEELRDSANYRFSIGFDYAANSNAAPASMLYGLLFGNGINQKVIDRADNRINKQLLFEDVMRTGITFKAKLKKWDGTIFGSYNHRQMRNISANKDAFQTVFYGNARFEGDTADFSNLRVYNYIYNQYTFGIKKNFDYGTYQMQFGAALSLLQVINQQEITTNNTKLYTAPDGEYLYVNYDLTFNNAKEGASKFGDLNGLGPSGDLNLAFMNKNKWKLSFDISDLGFIAMKKNPTNYSGAKEITFRGIVIPDLLNFNGSTFDSLNVGDTLRAFLPSKSNNEYSLFMPFTASLVFSHALLNQKLVLSAGIQYRYLPNYNVYGYIKANYFIKPDMVFSMSAGAGGYSLFNLGVEFSKSWKYFDFALGTSNLIGLVAPSHFTGTGLYLKAGTSF